MLVKQEVVSPLDATHKQLPRVRAAWIKPLTITRWAPIPDRSGILGLGLPRCSNQGLGDWLPILEQDKVAEKRSANTRQQ